MEADPTRLTHLSASEVSRRTILVSHEQQQFAETEHVFHSGSLCSSIFPACLGCVRVPVLKEAK